MKNLRRYKCCVVFVAEKRNSGAFFSVTSNLLIHSCDYFLQLQIPLSQVVSFFYSNNTFILSPSPNKNQCGPLTTFTIRTGGFVCWMHKPFKDQWTGTIALLSTKASCIMKFKCISTYQHVNRSLVLYKCVIWCPFIQKHVSKYACIHLCMYACVCERVREKGIKCIVYKSNFSCFFMFFFSSVRCFFSCL